MSKKVSQAELRTLMAKMKTDKAAAAKDKRLKKYKLGTKEMALIEHEKKRKAEEDNEERRKVARNAGVPENLFDSAKTKAFLNLNKAPQKSILKNRGSTMAPPAAPAANSKATGREWTSSAPTSNKKSSSFKTPAGGSIKHLEEAIPSDFFDAKMSAPAPEEPVAGPAENDAALPEGFFDDPIKDAKARGIEYKDPVEEEWEAFTKEIAVEVAASQDIQAEDMLEETTERQLEEVEEQIQAWSRVREIEIKKDVVDEKFKSKKASKEDENSDDEEMDVDEDLDEFLDWRLKKS